MELSYEDVQRLLGVALDKIASEGEPYRWVHATYSDRVIAANPREGVLESIPYKIDGTDVTFGEPTPVAAEYVELRDCFQVRSDPEGGLHWLAVSTTTGWDSKGTRHSAKALEEAIEYATKHDARGELRIEHVPNARIGLCTHQMFVAPYLIESGVFDDNVGSRCAAAVLASDEGAKYRVSIGFMYDKEKVVDDVFMGGVRIFERSVTRKPSNKGTAFAVANEAIALEGVRSLNNRAVEESLTELLGEEEASQVLSGGEEALQKLRKVLNVRFSSDEEEDAQDTPGTEAGEGGPDEEGARPEDSIVEEDTEDEESSVETEVQTSSDEGKGIFDTPDTVVLASDEASLVVRVASLESAVSGLRGDIKSLIKAFGTRSEDDDEDAPRSRVYRASEDEGRETTDEEKLAASNREREDFFSGMLGGDPVKIGSPAG